MYSLVEQFTNRDVHESAVTWQGDRISLFDSENFVTNRAKKGNNREREGKSGSICEIQLAPPPQFGLTDRWDWLRYTVLFLFLYIFEGCFPYPYAFLPSKTEFVAEETINKSNRLSSQVRGIYTSRVVLFHQQISNQRLRKLICEFKSTNSVVRLYPS